MGADVLDMFGLDTEQGLSLTMQAYFIMLYRKLIFKCKEEGLFAASQHVHCAVGLSWTLCASWNHLR